MKQFKYLILFFVFCLTCSFTTTYSVSTEFICDFTIDVSNFTYEDGSTYTYSYGQKFVCIYGTDSKANPGTTQYTINETVDHKKYVTINSSEDFKKIQNMSATYWDIPYYYHYTFFPIEDYKLGESMTFKNVRELTSRVFDTDVDSPDMENIDSLLKQMYDNDIRLGCSEVKAIDTMKPVINGYNGVYITNVDNPATKEEIQSHIKAIDDVDGDITSKIFASKDEYSDFSHVKGDHLLEFSVADEAGNTATLQITVRVVDSSKPVFTGPSEVNSYLSKPLTIEEINQQVTVKDNYDKEIQYTVKDGYSDNKTKVGDYDVVYTATDTSNNTQTKTVKVHVIDDVKPKISGPTSYETSIHKEILIDEIRDNLKAHDNVDGDIPSKNIETISSDYKPGTKGDYIVKFQVSDKAGNKSDEFTVNIKVSDHQKPIFYVDEFIINIEKGITMSQQEIISLLGETETIKMNNISNKEKQIVVTHDEYHESSEEGSFKLNLKITYDNGDNQDLKIIINRVAPHAVKLSTSQHFIYNLMMYRMQIDQFFSDLFDKIYYFFYNLFN